MVSEIISYKNSSVIQKQSIVFIEYTIYPNTVKIKIINASFEKTGQCTKG